MKIWTLGIVRQDEMRWKESVVLNFLEGWGRHGLSKMQIADMDVPCGHVAYSET